MITAGIDIGSRTAKSVILGNDNSIIASSMINTGHISEKSAKDIMDLSLQKAGIGLEDIKYIVSTGYGRINVPFCNKQYSEIMCHGVGAYSLFPKTHTVIDIGGQDSKAIQLSKNGYGDVKITDFVMNDKCAAGTGRFLEVMANVLEVRIEEMGDLSMKAKRKVNISSLCTVFAESEVISLIHQKYAREDIAKGLHQSIANKVLTIAKKIGIEEEITLTGGVAKNIGMVDAIEGTLNLKVNVPFDPQIIGALGAAVLARKEVINMDPIKV